jgi:predicted ATPase/DNA-binding CsgD family transcriptional regulator
MLPLGFSFGLYLWLIKLMQNLVLPVPPYPLIGREKELKTVADLLQQPEIRLVTLTGTGGVGKTRLALELGQRLSARFDLVAFVSLSAVTDPALVASSLAARLDIKEHSETELTQLLIRHLQPKTVLLILDNFEQVLDAAPLPGELLAACPRLKVLVTSRASLRLRAEREFPVPPLDLPDHQIQYDYEALRQNVAVNFFVQRAQAANPKWALNQENVPTVAEICTRLSGLPLALELAAARIKVLAPVAILERLENQLKLLVGGANDLPARQQTLRASLDWSYGLLTARQQAFLRRLAIFAGSWSLATALQVCQLSAEVEEEDELLADLTELVNHSLVTVLSETEAIRERRYALLEVIRQYAAERLAASGEQAATCQKLQNWAVGLVTSAQEPLWQGREQAYWFNRLETEHPNLRVALAWARDYDREAYARLAEGLVIFWDARGHLSEGRRWLEAVVAHADELSLPIRAKFWFTSGWLAHRQNDFELAKERCSLSLQLFRQIGDATGELKALLNLGWIALAQAEISRAKTLLTQSLQLGEQLGDGYCQAASLNYLGLAALAEGDYGQAAPMCEQSVLLCRKLGGDQFLGWALTGLGAVRLFQGEFEQARDLFLESLSQLEKVGDSVIIPYNIIGLAVVALVEERPLEAARLFGVGEAMREAIGTSLLPVFREPYQLAVSYAALMLDETALNTAWAQGRAMSLNAALQPALPAPESLPSEPEPEIVPAPTDLTPRELEVLQLLATGLTNAQIAEKLVLSTLTVNGYLRTVYSKLGVSSRSAATRYAYENKLI